MYGHDEIGMPLTTHVVIVNVWKLTMKETHKIKFPSSQFERVKVPNKFPTIQNGSHWICESSLQVPKFPRTSKLQERVS